MKYKSLLLPILFLLSNVNGQALKFPESFKSDTSLFKGLVLSRVPQDVQEKYGITKNPGTITNVQTAKGLLMSGNIPGVQSIYFEMYEDTLERSMDVGFEIAEFTSITDLQNALLFLDKKNRNAAFLTVDRYLIIAASDGYKDYEARIDATSRYFQQKLGATMYQDRRKDKMQQPQQMVEIKNPLDTLPSGVGIIKHIPAPEPGPVAEWQTSVEETASFPGGHTALHRYIGQQLVYPKSAIEKGIQGKVVAKFVVEKDGSISNITIERSLSPDCDAAVIKVLKNMPKWTPAKKDRKPVRSYMRQPVGFSVDAKK